MPIYCKVRFGRVFASLMERIRHSRVPIIPEAYSKDLRKLGGEMLTRNPHRRPSAALLLQMPLLQVCMAKLLEEEEPLGATKAQTDVRRRSFDAGDLRYKDTAGSFEFGDQVEYCAEMGSDWLPGTVIGVNKDGWIRIDLLPDLWLRKQDQATRVRPGKPKPSSAGPTPKAPQIVSPLLNEKLTFMMGPCPGLDSPSRKRGPSPSLLKGIESSPRKRRAARPSPGPPIKHGPLHGRVSGYGASLFPQSKDDLSGMDGIRKRSSLEPPGRKHGGMSRSPSCPSNPYVTRMAGRHIIGG